MKPRPSVMSEPNVQADLYRPASSVLELRGVSCAYERRASGRERHRIRRS